MLDDTPRRAASKLGHRGRLQAQGGGTEKSVTWSGKTPPNLDEMLKMCDQLESRLTASERRIRQEAFKQLREFLRAAASCGGMSTPPPIKKSFPRQNADDVRVDLEVLKGTACAPAAKSS